MLISDEAIWDKLKEEIIEEALQIVGLSALNPLGKLGVYLIGKFLDKFVKPRFDIGVAHGIKHWVKTFESRKLKEIDDAVANKDRGKVISIIDKLK